MYKYAMVVKLSAGDKAWYENLWDNTKDFFGTENGQRLLYGGAGALGSYLVSSMFTRNKGVNLLMALLGGGLAGWKGYDWASPYVNGWLGKKNDNQAQNIYSAKGDGSFNPELTRPFNSMKGVVDKLVEKANGNPGQKFMGMIESKYGLKRKPVLPAPAPKAAPAVAAPKVAPQPPKPVLPADEDGEPGGEQ